MKKIRFCVGMQVKVINNNKFVHVGHFINEKNIGFVIRLFE